MTNNLRSAKGATRTRLLLAVTLAFAVLAAPFESKADPAQSMDRIREKVAAIAASAVEKSADPASSSRSTRQPCARRW
jgi:hypothetical protein